MNTPNNSPSIVLTQHRNSGQFPVSVTFGSPLEFDRNIHSPYGVSINFLGIIQTLLTPFDTEIVTFKPEPYRVKCPIKLSVSGKGEEWTASHWASNIHASGETEIEAIENVKSLILDIFDTLTSEPEENLGPKPSGQLAVLHEFIERET